MEQEGIDALAELWEETGTLRKIGGKKCYGRHGNTQWWQSSHEGLWLVSGQPKKTPDCCGLVQTEPIVRHLNSYLFCIRVNSPLGLFLELVQTNAKMTIYKCTFPNYLLMAK